MQIKAVIFDMDGLLIDSEPFWQEAGEETLSTYKAALSDEQYQSSTGLRTREWVNWWFDYFEIDMLHAEKAEATIIASALDKIGRHGKSMPGVDYLFNSFTAKKLKIGLASSSPMALIEVVAKKLNIIEKIDVLSSAENLLHGKPHPQVFLDCAGQLGVSPLQCLVFEDSLNGVIAAKAARMKCVAIPAKGFRDDPRWAIADQVLNSLEEFDDRIFDRMQN